MKLSAILAMASVLAVLSVATADEEPPPPPVAVKTGEQPETKKKEESAGDEIAKLFPLESEEWLKDPFMVLNMEMESVVTDFGESKPKPPAETTQPRIVSRFDSLIAVLEKSCNGTGGGNGGRPAQASVIRKGPGGMGELRAARKSGKGFEDLTPMEREKVLQSKTEGFPPGFEDVLADYFRRLSSAEQAAPPATDDTAAESSQSGSK